MLRSSKGTNSLRSEVINAVSKRSPMLHHRVDLISTPELAPAFAALNKMSCTLVRMGESAKRPSVVEYVFAFIDSMPIRTAPLHVLCVHLVKGRIVCPCLRRPASTPSRNNSLISITRCRQTKLVSYMKNLIRVYHVN